jgi:hypothetical protein
MGIEHRETVEETLKRHLHFEQMVSDLSARFMTAPLDQVDSEIENVLRQIMEFFQIDRCQGLVGQAIVEDICSKGLRGHSMIFYLWSQVTI